MNIQKLKSIFDQLNDLAKELDEVEAAYNRLGKNRTGSLKLVLGNYLHIEIAKAGWKFERGMDMIVLGLQKHLNAQVIKLKTEIKQLQAEIDKEIGSIA